jgi:hypothetical protein
VIRRAVEHYSYCAQFHLTQSLWPVFALSVCTIQGIVRNTVKSVSDVLACAGRCVSTTPSHTLNVGHARCCSLEASISNRTPRVEGATEQSVLLCLPVIMMTLSLASKRACIIQQRSRTSSASTYRLNVRTRVVAGPEPSTCSGEDFYSILGVVRISYHSTC